MFRYEDEVFGDSEPELDEGEVTFKVERFFHHSLRKSMNLQKLSYIITESKPLSPFGICCKQYRCSLYEIIKMSDIESEKNSQSHPL